MRHTKTFVIATALLSLSLMSISPVRQTVVNGQEPTPQKAAVGEVDRLLAELNNKQETIVSSCLENCDKQKRANPDLSGGEFDERVQPEYPAIARAARAQGSQAASRGGAGLELLGQQAAGDHSPPAPRQAGPRREAR